MSDEFKIPEPITLRNIKRAPMYEIIPRGMTVTSDFIVLELSSEEATRLLEAGWKVRIDEDGLGFMKVTMSDYTPPKLTGLQPGARLTGVTVTPFAWSVELMTGTLRGVKAFASELFYELED